MIRRTTLAAVTIAAAFTATPALAATHYAAPNGSAANWPCTSSSSPCDLTTAIEGNGAQEPAAGDEVVIGSTGTPYTLGAEEIIAPVSENIHGAAGAPAPQINDAFASGSTGVVLAALALHGGQLTHVKISITQTGNNQDTSAAQSYGGTTFDDDVFSAVSSGHAHGVTITANDNLLDTVAVADGPGADGVLVTAYAGSTPILRNVTADAAGGANSDAVYAIESPNGSPTQPCPPADMTVSLRNVVAQSSGPALSGSQSCPSGVVDFDIDYSDYAPAPLPAGLTSTQGANNINQAGVFVDPASIDFHEQAGSPTIDKGTDAPQDGTTDPDGRGRSLGAAPDIGAYEYPAAGAVTGDATDVTGTAARMTGSIDSEGTGTTLSWAFEYGTSPSLGKTVPVPAGTAPGTTTIPSPHAVNELLTGLQPGTTYYYRVRATNADGETFGATRTFTTNPNVKVVFAGTGHGVVNSSPNKGGCGGPTCTLSLTAGAQETLTATADTGSVFAGWSGGGCTGTKPCTITPTTNATITATFTKEGRPTLTHVTLTGVAKGKPKLRFTVTQGANAPEIKRLEITITGGFTFGKLHHAIHVNDKIARARVAKGVLIIKLPVAVHQLKLTLIKPAITVTRARHHRLKLTVTVKDVSGARTPLVHQQK